MSWRDVIPILRYTAIIRGLWTFAADFVLLLYIYIYRYIYSVYIRYDRPEVPGPCLGVGARRPVSVVMVQN